MYIYNIFLKIIILNIYYCYIIINIDIDLPAKYWLNNSLSHEDIISNGFYDLGYAGTRVGLNDVFPTLKELSEIPVDKKREIILIDIENDNN